MVILVALDMLALDSDREVLQDLPCCCDQIKVGLLGVWDIARTEDTKGMCVVASEKNISLSDLMKGTDSLQ